VAVEKFTVRRATPRDTDILAYQRREMFIDMKTYLSDAGENLTL